METVVFGKHVEVTPRLQALTEQKLARLERFARDVRRIEVDYGKINNPRVADCETCEILVHLTGHLVKGHAAAPDQQAAFDIALDKVEQQLRRLHDRRTRKRGGRRDNGDRASSNGSPAHVVEDGALDFAYEVEEESDVDGAVIVKSKQFVVKPMSPEEAVLQMDLLGHDFFLFTSSENGRAAVIYRRRDGNLGLIESAG